MFIVEAIRDRKIKAGELRSARREDAWLTSEAGPIGLFVGKGLQELGLVGDRQITDKDRQRALERVSQKYIVADDEVNEEEVSLLGGVFSEGVFAVMREQGLGEVAQKQGITRERCFDLLEQAFEIARDEYRNELDSEWKP